MGGLPLSLVARSTNATLASTQFQVILSENCSLRMLGLIGHNLSLDAGVRYRLYGDAAQTELLHDTGFFDVWPRVYPFGTLPWYDKRWWNGKYSAEQIARFTTITPLLLGTDFSARAIRVEIADTTNPDGWIQIGMMEPAGAWQFSINPDPGAEYGLNSRSVIRQTQGGAEDYDRRIAERSWRGQITYLERDEALAKGFDFLQDTDTTDPFIWMPRPPSASDPRAAEHLLRTCFLARNRSLGLLRFATPHSHDSFFIDLKEVL